MVHLSWVKSMVHMKVKSVTMFNVVSTVGLKSLTINMMSFIDSMVESRLSLKKMVESRLVYGKKSDLLVHVRQTLV